MMHSLTTVATFNTVEEAALARNRLDEEGIKTFLENENTVQLFWHMGNALGGVKLQVADTEADAARAILAEHHTDALMEHEFFQEEQSEECEGEALLQADTTEEPEQEPNNRETNALRAYRSAIVTFAFFPFAFYTYWLIYNVVVADHPLRPEYQRKAVFAACVCIPIMLGHVLFILWFR